MGVPPSPAYVSIHNMVAWMVASYASDAQVARLDAQAFLDGLAVDYCLTGAG